MMSSLRDKYNAVARQLAEPDFLLMASIGRIPGYSTEFIIGDNDDIDQGAAELIWDQGGMHTPLAVPSDIYVSSTSAADNTGIKVLIRGLDENYNSVIGFAVLTGQSQAAVIIPGAANNLFVWVQSALVLDVTAAGDLYIASTDTLTAGVPDDITKIQSKIILGNNVTRNGQIMIPAGKSAITLAIRGTTDDLTKVALVSTHITRFGQPELITVDYTVTPNFGEYTFPVPVGAVDNLGESTPVLGAKTILKFVAQSNSNNTHLFFATDILLVDEDIFGYPD